MKNVPSLVKGQNNNKGVQLEYKLIPLAVIEQVVMEEKKPTNRDVQFIDDKKIVECEHKMEELLEAKRKFNELFERVKENAHVLSGQVLVDFNNIKSKTSTDEKTFLKNLSESLVQVCFGFILPLNISKKQTNETKK